MAKARAAEAQPIEKASDPAPVNIIVQFPSQLTMAPTETVAERGEDGLVKRSVTRPLSD